MKAYSQMSKTERQAALAAAEADYEALRELGLSLNIARGIPIYLFFLLYYYFI